MVNHHRPIGLSPYRTKVTLMNLKISTIIPFFQRTEGILRKAVLSALNQKAIHRHQIIVIDDDSPVPAKNELADLLARYAQQLVILKKDKNGGPAAARNHGLDHVSQDTDIVAFLDSDDEWIETHLQNGAFTFDKGFDFYFSDHYQLNQTVSAFNRAKRINITEHRGLDGLKNIYKFEGDMFSQILTGNIIGTSTVMYRYRKFPGLRFKDDLFYAGEDYLFWLELCTRTDKIAFSTQCECTYGKGVNVFSASVWGTDKFSVCIQDLMKYKKAVRKLFTLNDHQRANINRELKELRFEFARDLLHRMTHWKRLDARILLKQFRLDPLTFVLFVPNCAIITAHALKAKLSRH
jgi:succinoglycan biosynthesis protein ExoW